MPVQCDIQSGWKMGHCPTRQSKVTTRYSGNRVGGVEGRVERWGFLDPQEPTGRDALRRLNPLQAINRRKHHNAIIYFQADVIRREKIIRVSVLMNDRCYVITISDFSEEATNQIIAGFDSVFGGKQRAPSRWNALRIFSPKAATAIASATTA